MISRAVARYLRVSPRKIRTVIYLLKGKYASDALALLKNTNKRAAHPLTKLINSSIANAKRLPNIRKEDLYISNIFADGGPMLKRYKAQALGRATMIKRRTSHVTVELDIKELPPAKEKRTKKAVAIKKEQR